MNCEFITLDRKGDSPLHGLLFPGSDSLVLHIHGSWGNFYENPFAVGLSSIYNKHGFTYATVNTPGHDFGTIHEDFDESLDCIVSWVNNINSECNSIVLQGHSLGALKILRMFQESHYEEFLSRVKGLVLLAPFDLVGFYGGQNIDRRREHAKEFRDQNGEEALVPSTIFDIWPISVKTFLELSEPDSEFDLFPTRKNEIGSFRNLEIPTLVAIGENDIASYPLPEKAIELLNDGNNKIETRLLENAPHNFVGEESNLYSLIDEFVKNLNVGEI